MNKLKKTVLIIAAMAFSLFAFTVIINLPAFDEQLSSEVQAIKQMKATPFDKSNAFPDLLAMGNEETDLFESSKKIRTLLNHKIESKGLDYFDEHEYSQYIRKDLDTEWMQKYQTCNSRRDKNCAWKVIQLVNDHPISNPRLNVQLNKYRQLITKKSYQESIYMDITAPLPAYGPVMSLKRLNLANSYINDETETFLKVATKDYQFWRMMFENSHWLITRMVADASIKDNIGFFSLAVQQGKFNSNQLLSLQEQLVSLTPDKTDMDKVFDFEFKFGIGMYEAADQSGELNTQKFFDFFQLNATHNLAYELTTKTMRKVANMSSHEFYQYLSLDPEDQIERYEFNWTPASLYNPTGKLLVSYAHPAYNDYIARVHDLNGMIFLLKLQIELALNADRPKVEVIANSKFVNPYTLKPMNYNEQSNSIYFECMDKASICELLL